MKGTVTGRQPRIEVVFRSPNQPDLSIEFVVDTGFAGYLAMPIAAVTALKLPFSRPLDAHLADNSTISVDIHLASILWNGTVKIVDVLAMGKQPLLGASLLYNNRLGIDFVNGGDVVILPRP